jgi:vitamin B12 transporter
MKHFLVVAALIAGSPLIAQVTDSSSLADVIVTAHKYPRKQTETGKSVTVIDRAELDRSRGRSLAELLNRQPGITVIGANNSPGTNQDIYLRGAGVGRTLILLNGIPVYDPSSISTAFDINTIPVETIERIEIVKGALSTLYGSDAVAGVINIITRKGGVKPVQGFATLATGSSSSKRAARSNPAFLDAAKAAFGVNGKVALLDYGAAYTHFNAGRPSAAYDSTGSNGYDEDGMNQDAFDAHAAITPVKGLRLEAFGQHSKYTAGLDAAAFKDDADYNVTVKNTQLGMRNSYSLGKIGLHANYQYSTLERRYLDDSASRGSFSYYSHSKYIGRTHFGELYADVKALRFLDVLVGADHRAYDTDQEALYISAFGPYKTTLNSDSAKAGQSSVFASLLLHDLKGFNFELGGRANFHSEYGSNTTYTINPSYLAMNKVKLFVNYATGFKVPSPYQLFDAFAGNRALEPEESETLEGGIALLPLKGFTAQAAYFTRTTRHGIDYNFATNKYFNYNKQDDHGFEVEGGYTSPRFNWKSAYSYVTGKVSMKNFVFNPSTFEYDIKGDTTYNNLFRRPANMFTTTIGGKPLGALYIGATYKWVDERMEPVFGAAPIELKSYSTVDLYADYPVSNAVRLFADAQNIFGEKYFDVRGYNARRFNFMVGAQVSF